MTAPYYASEEANLDYSPPKVTNETETLNLTLLQAEKLTPAALQPDDHIKSIGGFGFHVTHSGYVCC